MVFNEPAFWQACFIRRVGCEKFIKNNINVNELHLKEENLEKYFMRLIQGGAA